MECMEAAVVAAAQSPPPARNAWIEPITASTNGQSVARQLGQAASSADRNVRM